jgi:multimeric flavodoxin WrbA
MSIKILAIYGSPRNGGNTSLLMDAFLRGCKTSKKVEITKIFTAKTKITPCMEYYTCIKTGYCKIKDKMTPLYNVLQNADIIALASPIFFYGLSAQAKTLIDRCQVFWARKHILKDKFIGSRAHEFISKRKGIFISTAATRGKKVFDGALLTVKYFFEALNVEQRGSLLFRLFAENDNIIKHPTALREAYEIGRKIIKE